RRPYSRRRTVSPLAKLRVFERADLAQRFEHHNGHRVGQIEGTNGAQRRNGETLSGTRVEELRGQTYALFAEYERVPGGERDVVDTACSPPSEQPRTSRAAARVLAD